MIDRLESIHNNFFWGGVNSNEKVTWVAWTKVINSREKGGLDIGSVRTSNLTLIVKWWRFRREEGSIKKKGYPVYSSIHVVMDALVGLDLLLIMVGFGVLLVFYIFLLANTTLTSIIFHYSKQYMVMDRGG